MRWYELLTWVNDPIRTQEDLQSACTGLGLVSAGGTVAQLRTRVRNRISTMADLNVDSAWTPAGWVPPRPALLRQSATPVEPVSGPPQPTRWRRLLEILAFLILAGVVLAALSLMLPALVPPAPRPMAVAVATTAAATATPIVVVVTATPPASVQPTSVPTMPPTATPTQVAPPQVVIPSFNPIPFYSQSCAPEHTSGCSWDVGTMGSLTDVLGRQVVQVGVVKGVKIDWPKGNLVASSSANNRCALVLLQSNSWFENLHTIDANVTVYNVDARDVNGWLKTLGVQNAFEQQSNYGCPVKRYPEDIPIWSSNIPSPPCGTPGFPACTGGQLPAPAQPVCDTTNCKERRASVDLGGRAQFVKGEAVYGFRIVLNSGKRFSDCWIEVTEEDGYVEDGVVNLWRTEAQKARKCQ